MTVTSTLSLDLGDAIGPFNTVLDGTQSGVEAISLANGLGVAYVYRSDDADQVPVLEIVARSIQTISLAPLGTTFDMVGDPDIIQLSNGNIVVAWAGGPSSSDGQTILGVIINPVTHAIVKAVFFVPSGLGGSTDPELTALTDGKWVAVYQNVEGDATIQMLNADGTQFGDEIDVSVPQHAEHHLAVTALTGGGFAITYTETDPVNGDLDVMAAVYSANGSLVKAPFEAGLGQYDDQSQPAMIALRNGGFAVAFLDTDGVTPQIFLRSFNAAGIMAGGFAINLANVVGDPDVSLLPNGDLFVTWTVDTAGHLGIHGIVVGVRDDGTFGAIATSINGGLAAVELAVADFPPGTDFTDSSTAISSAGGLLSMFTFNDTDDGVGAAGGKFFTNHVGDGAADLVIGDDLVDVADMGGGNDTVLGRGGNDTLSGRAGKDTLLGEAGDDYIDGGANADVMIGGAGIDKLTYVDSDASVSVNLATGAASGGFATGDIFNGFENLEGSSFSDSLTGKAGANTLAGLDGSDTYNLGAEEQGVDTIVEEDGGGTADTITSTITRSLAAYGNIENLTLLGTLAINGTGSAEDNTITGNGAANILHGGAGSGIDTLIGGLGRDRLTGGLGNDIFKFNAITESRITAATRDIVTDFSHLQDKINLFDIDAKTSGGGSSGNNAFSAVLVHGTAATSFGGVQGKIIWYQENRAGTVNDKTIIRLNVDADAANDMTIELKGLINLTLADFTF